jgi:hypothetical protein
MHEYLLVKNRNTRYVKLLLLLDMKEIMPLRQWFYIYATLLINCADTPGAD